MEDRISLALEDGSIITGQSFGAHTDTEGEVVFNTSMVGYPESLTDPSYRGQILVLTYPLIGNYGVPEETTDQDGLQANFESEKPHIRALIVSEYSDDFSHWNAKESLGSWLIRHGIPAISGVDTRALTQKIREKGTMLGRVMTKNPTYGEVISPDTTNLADEVATKEIIAYKRGQKHISIVDTGCKANIIRDFLKRDITVTRIPWDQDPFELKTKFDGIFFSNGPGDPMLPQETHNTMRKCFERKIPTCGICLGSQIMGIAAGAKTYKLKYGHRAQNQPCTDMETGRCYITSQNHGFAIDEKTIPKDWSVWFKNQNDNTVEGLKHKKHPFLSVQFHPEATPGPTDTSFVFDRFIELL
ncbi:carbamoyl-phosphate synthase (glutamine-hydrolyzing) small subunit [Candidatus Peregrinibacteria bacterium CG_4_9_14_0_8_um_filter_44_15]|nr:MAG: carbamoyl phosphate synthase small subunit [Candidatus Peregrinibacteria bacterium CG2_30_44_17]PIX80278.1 MAG: carbamoyl-phosphate synthase (glutamine-hydrolyzing) small subunit [Candidatus Peregrinibacteria bacterium CG_4_10_14_3_um_filter_44_21]PJB89164.1 MAG: carbamoyl-phosphate synthase (glutamine-hydrolyzing) small subunit [Candidatus Peregrinibacteria bacterium CG_4_9_14_0_8_um_filter_44_15]